jgi:hypothetical protein
MQFLINTWVTKTLRGSPSINSLISSKKTMSLHTWFCLVTSIYFGHTHKPFVNTTENAANTVSWVTDATDAHNTYVELSGGKLRLFVFGGREM